LRNKGFAGFYGVNLECGSLLPLCLPGSLLPGNQLHKRPIVYRAAFFQSRQAGTCESLKLAFALQNGVSQQPLIQEEKTGEVIEVSGLAGEDRKAGRRRRNADVKMGNNLLNREGGPAIAFPRL
jgi:hypothetical protein